MDKTVQRLIRRFKTNCPFEIAERLNIQVWYCDLGENTRGMYYRKLRRRFIAIHSGLSEPWQKFICAHELAHDRLHPGISRFFLDERSFSNAGKYERQANQFAVKLLTASTSPEPGETIERFLRRCSIPPELHKFLS
ncbi:ImmA/IrrE family metallo-endopeptidase [Paenibacillus polymyxa]|uniref:ImmA/IrrE family metallo-endopeptidase n=1 Tax=Paenibacillus polymyxa TaxID=1406 RepID=A0A8I1IJI4_PAEPO|nr:MULTISPECIES: ImmA/IrrE family metallo-endopeptidase [Paenibacillus]KAF6576532.1 ImmA/IrrE family metallo-endopeptidase [Paenibacillus sp. EKM206P]KAF6591334.1 ImmA/IrrE family metallo-endopeptidase [Paenibacillus sp. EKM205P]MBM0632024.1 ImmA/IrrE family metallo-endopeptidase [Paenibacillus polymyxa]